MSILKPTKVKYLFYSIDAEGKQIYQFRRRLSSSGTIQRSLFTSDIAVAAVLLKVLNTCFLTVLKEGSCKYYTRHSIEFKINAQMLKKTLQAKFDLILTKAYTESRV